MGNQNVACCGAPITDKAALTQGTVNSKWLIQKTFLEMKTKKKDRNPNIFEDKKS